MDASSVGCYSLFMGYGWIAFVLSPVVLGKNSLKLFHQQVAFYLSNDRSCRNALVSCITTNDTGMGYLALVMKSVSIDQQQLWSYTQLLHSAVHS